MFCARLFICAFWSPAGKGLTSWLSFVVSSVSLSLSHWYPGSGVVLDCIDSRSLHHYLPLICRYTMHQNNTIEPCLRDITHGWLNNLNSKQRYLSKEIVFLIFAHCLIFLLKNTSHLFSKNQTCPNQLYFYHNKLRISIHLCQVKQYLLTSVLYLLYPSFWTVLDETL